MSSSPSTSSLDDIISPRSRMIRQIAIYTLLGVYTVFVAVTTYLFIRQSKARQGRDLVKRSVALVSVQTAGGYIVGLLGLLSTARNDTPCIVKLWLMNCGMTLFALGVMTRSWNFIVQANLHNIKSRLAADIAETNRINMERSGLQLQHENSTYAGTVTPLAMSVKNSLIFDETSLRHPYHLLPAAMAQQQEKSGDTVSVASSGCLPEHSRKLQKRLRKYMRLQQFAKTRTLLLFVAAFMACIIIMTAVFSAVTPYYSIHPLNRVCGLDWPEFPALIMLGFTLVVICPILLAQVWTLNDAFGIKYDLIICVTLAVFDLALAMAWEVKLKRLRLIFSGLFFAWLSVISVHITSVVIPLVRSRRLARRLHLSWPESSFESALTAHNLEQKMLGMRTQGFIDMLENPIQYEEFRQFTAQSFCSELTSFIDDYQLIKAYTVRSLGGKPKDTDSSLDIHHAVIITEDSEGEESVLGRLFGRRNNQHSSSPGLAAKNTLLHTSAVHGIFETVAAQYPQKRITKSTQFPGAVVKRVNAFIGAYIRPEAGMAVNLPGTLVDEILHAQESGDMSIAMLDQAKNETIRLLYTDVYVRYTARRTSVI